MLTPTRTFTLITALSALALAMAYGSQIVFGLKPCILCLYQRAPFAVAILLGLTGFSMRKNQTAARAILALCALTFLVNACIAAYHTGVERHWWESAAEGCKVPGDMNDPNWIAKLTTTPSAPCTDIQWKDPLIGLTMANDNVLFCLALSALCAYAAMLTRRPAR